MRNMLNDLLYDNYDIPQMYLYFRSNITKQNKKNKGEKKPKAENVKPEQKKEVEKPKQKEEAQKPEMKKEIPEVPQPMMENNDLFDLPHMRLPTFDNDDDVDEFGIPKEMAEEFWKPVKIENSKNQEPPVELPKKEESINEIPKKEEEFTNEIPKKEEELPVELPKQEEQFSDSDYDEEEEDDLEEPIHVPEPSNEFQKCGVVVEDKKNEVVEEEKPKEIVPEQEEPEEIVSEPEDEDFTCEIRTITKKGGFKHTIRTERSEETGIVIVTETREIGNQSMTLKKIIYTDGDIEQFETRKAINDDELEDFKAKWMKAFPQE